jgi:hypothetical protein
VQNFYLLIEPALAIVSRVIQLIKQCDSSKFWPGNMGKGVQGNSAQSDADPVEGKRHKA